MKKPILERCLSHENPIAEEANDFSPEKDVQSAAKPEGEDSSQSFNWQSNDNDVSELQPSKDLGYINDCIQNIKDYYSDKEKEEESEDASDHSQSSSFHMDQDPLPVEDLIPLVDDADVHKYPKKSDQTHEIGINDDLKDVVDTEENEQHSEEIDNEGAMENLFAKNIGNVSSEDSPIVDQTSPDNAFSESVENKDQSENLENLSVPDKPTISESLKVTEAQNFKDLSLESPENKKFEDPQLTPESERKPVDEKEEQGKLIADQLLHLLLCELDDDKGINKAMNTGEEPEEMPSFLMRGIQTDTLSIAQYLNELFDNIKEDKESFLESLATPLNRDPLEILKHLQDIEADSNDSESENIPFQQSILPVELYLENEKLRRINRMSEEERQEEKDKALAKKQIRAQKMQEEGVIFDEDDFDDDESIMAEWENIHNKVVFD